MLLRSTKDQGCGQGVQDAYSTNRLQKLKVSVPKATTGPWQSLGGYFDYSDWVARDRFVELDKAIHSIGRAETPIEADVFAATDADSPTDACYAGHLEDSDRVGRLEQRIARARTDALAA